MSASQDGLSKEKTPRRTTRRTTATPVRDISPPAHNTRAASTAIQHTPATRRSARAASRRPDQPRDVVNNNVLPEVQTRQSYAYGSSKTPILPEQLHVRDTLTMKQVADQMESAMNRAEQNLDNYAADVEDGRRQLQPQVSKGQATRRSPNQPSPPASVTTDIQKKQRTAAWASSLDSGQLDDIPEEEQPQIDTPETRRTEPSSFPSGIFDQSYQYERGLRPPRRPPGPKPRSLGSRFDALVERLISYWHKFQQQFLHVTYAIGRWLSRLSSSISTTLYELPDSRLLSSLIKSFFIILLAGIMSYCLCFGYTRHLCNTESSSRISKTLESLCGSCRSTPSYIDLPTGPQPDLIKLTAALKHIDGQIRSIESRINSRLDSQVSALHTDIDDLRKEQTNLVQQMQDVSNHVSQPSSSPDVASPLISKVNYFSPANGAVVNVRVTSPTRQAPMAFSLRVMTRILGIEKYRAYNPVTALEPWHDVGDCWCAAATSPGQDSIRLGVGVREYIFPTELVIEHPPKDVTLMPETAPRHVELWADFGHLDEAQWQALGIDLMVKPRDELKNPFGKTYGLIAAVEYDLATHKPHIQKFTLDVNQFGETKYSAIEFAVRVRSTYGGEYGCLYRVRLHGTPVEQQKDVLGSSTESTEDDSLR